MEDKKESRAGVVWATINNVLIVLIFVLGAAAFVGLLLWVGTYFVFTRSSGNAIYVLSGFSSIIGAAPNTAGLFARVNADSSIVTFSTNAAVYPNYVLYGAVVVFLVSTICGVCCRKHKGIVFASFIGALISCALFLLNGVIFSFVNPDLMEALAAKEKTQFLLCIDFPSLALAVSAALISVLLLIRVIVNLFKKYN